MLKIHFFTSGCCKSHVVVATDNIAKSEKKKNVKKREIKPMMS